jgi:DNA-binding LytR/AlgR family response regulator
VNAPHYDADLFRETTVPDAVLPPLRILVVEDEGLIALNLELMLRRFGCEIIGPISEVDDIVGAARTHNPDGAFLDVNLRGRKVFDVMPEMMSLGVPCVLSSGYDDPMLFPAAFRDLPRIAKPFDEKALRCACAAFGLLAETRQAEARQANRGGEHCAVPFPRRRRAALPALPVGPEGVPPSRAAAGPRGR